MCVCVCVEYYATTKNNLFVAAFGSVSVQKVSIKFHISYSQMRLRRTRNEYRTTQE
jgi:hypothetical protein